MLTLTRFFSVFVLSLSLSSGLMTAGQASAAGEASDGAKNLPGATGTIVFQPEDWQEGKTTWWKDTDGIAPGVAGCHLGTDSEGATNGRMFGEACLENGRLVESNPGKNEVHSHANDTGHPDTFDCAIWCMSTLGTKGGSCQAAAAPPCEASARCVCE